MTEAKELRFAARRALEALMTRLVDVRQQAHSVQRAVEFAIGQEQPEMEEMIGDVNAAIGRVSRTLTTLEEMEAAATMISKDYDEAVLALCTQEMRRIAP